MRKIPDLLRQGEQILLEAGNDNPREEARLLFEGETGLDRNRRLWDNINTVDEAVAAAFLAAVDERSKGRPLQYILGQWDFYGRSFFVGEGVLIPRPETEMLVEFALDYLKTNPCAKVLDLCAGSGCIGLTVAAEAPDATVILLEKSPDALKYLQKNKEAFGLTNAHIVAGDLFDGPASYSIEHADVLLSNPPYIADEQVPLLQAEVRKEPVMALAGGTDGLDFYRAIAAKWLPAVNEGGLIALECGEEQTEAVAGLLAPFCDSVACHRDFQNLPRSVTAKKLR